MINLFTATFHYCLQAAASLSVAGMALWLVSGYPSDIDMSVNNHYLGNVF